MSIVKATLKTAAEQQQILYNSAGPHVLRRTYTPAAGAPWCVLGCVMNDLFDPDVHENAVINGIQALPEVTAVVNPRLYGMTPDVLLINPEPPADLTHELQLHVTSGMSCLLPGLHRSRTVQEHATAKPPVAKKWLVLVCLLHVPLNTAGIAALESAVEGVLIGGVQAVTVCKHLIGDTVPADASEIRVQVEARLRIDPIPVEEP